MPKVNVVSVLSHHLSLVLSSLPVFSVGARLNRDEAKGEVNK